MGTGEEIVLIEKEELEEVEEAIDVCQKAVIPCTKWR